MAAAAAKRPDPSGGGDFQRYQYNILPGLLEPLRSSLPATIEAAITVHQMTARIWRVLSGRTRLVHSSPSTSLDPAEHDLLDATVHHRSHGSRLDQAEQLIAAAALLLFLLDGDLARAPPDDVAEAEREV